jgi:hypothetical protein
VSLTNDIMTVGADQYQLILNIKLIYFSNLRNGMLLGGHLTEHIELHRVTINLRFPCKVFIVLTISSQSKELKKIQTRSVELVNNEGLF